MEGIEPRIHEDHTAEKGDNSLHHDIVVAREIGAPRRTMNRRRWTREGPEPACVLSPMMQVWHTQERRAN